MLNSHWLSAPFILQMLCMAADEFWFHRKRGLPRWERIGHPLDTLTVVLCMAWILFVPPDRRAALIFVALAVFSSIFVTKDEPVHKRHCSAAEQWVHSVLFLLHPVVLASAALLWPGIWRGGLPMRGWPYWLLGVVRFSGFERSFLISACALMIGFGVYQFVFWNLLWHSKKTSR
jgi:hypothetical protein